MQRTVKRRIKFISNDKLTHSAVLFNRFEGDIVKEVVLIQTSQNNWIDFLMKLVHGFKITGTSLL